MNIVITEQQYRLILEQTSGTKTPKGFENLPFPKNKTNDIGFENLPFPKNKTNDIGFENLPFPKNKTNTKLTELMMLLMRKVYFRYKPLGRNGLDTNKKKHNEVLEIQKYFNSTGDLGKGKKYGLLDEDGVFDENTFWQINNTLGSVDRVWWLKNKY
jgi:hypothetical protein